MRHNFSAETEARPVFTVPKPLPERQRDADGNFLPDTPLGEPYPGYSMMEMLRREHEELRSRSIQYREPDPPAVRPTPQSSKKKKKV